jgi:hypothetical protein
MIEATAKSDPSDHALPSTGFLRELCNSMWVWRLCDAARCRRARACRGAPRRCLARHAPLVPEEARAFVVRMFAMRQEGATFEEMIAELAQEKTAFEEWVTALMAATGRGAVQCHDESFRGAANGSARSAAR